MQNGAPNYLEFNIFPEVLQITQVYITKWNLMIIKMKEIL